MASGRLVGAECIVDRTAAKDAERGERSVSPGLRALEDTMELVDALLRVGCPLPLTVALTGADFDDPGLLPMLEGWSMEHGGAHRLLGIEIDVRRWDRRSLLVSRRIAAFGYDLTLAGATSLEPTVVRYCAKRFAFPASLVRLADIDEDLAAELRGLAEDVRGYGLEPVFKGVVDPERSACLRGVRPDGVWQPDVAAVSFDAACLHAVAEDFVERRASRPAAVATGFRDGAGEDLTWVTVDEEEPTGFDEAEGVVFGGR